MLARPIVHDALWRCLCPSFPSIRMTTYGASTYDRRLRPPPQKPQLRAFNNTADPEPTPHLPLDAFGTRRHLPKRSNPTRSKTPLVHLQTVELYEHLRREAAAGKYNNVMGIIRILIKDRREKPNATLYAAVLHSFVDPEEGTAGKIRKVLDEMSAEGIELDARGCHCILEVT